MQAQTIPLDLITLTKNQLSSAEAVFVQFPSNDFNQFMKECFQIYQI